MNQLEAGRIDDYLARLGISERPRVSGRTLRRLQRAHLMVVPFENLDIHTGRLIRLDLDALYDKIIGRARGGFCYELNGLFGALLAGLGFNERLVSSRVWMPDGTLSPPFDHAALLVDLEEPWLVDVGYGDAFLLPRPLGSGWEEAGRRLRSVPIDSGWRLESDRGQGWSAVYDLDPTPRDLEDFGPRCAWHQQSNQSVFRRHPLVSRATPSGRVTVAGQRLIVTSEGHRIEEKLSDREALEGALGTHFGPAFAEQYRIALGSP